MTQRLPSAKTSALHPVGTPVTPSALDASAVAQVLNQVASASTKGSYLTWPGFIQIGELSEWGFFCFWVAAVATGPRAIEVPFSVKNALFADDIARR